MNALLPPPKPSLLVVNSLERAPSRNFQKGSLEEEGEDQHPRGSLLSHCSTSSHPHHPHLPAPELPSPIFLLPRLCNSALYAFPNSPPPGLEGICKLSRSALRLHKQVNSSHCQCREEAHRQPRPGRVPHPSHQALRQNEGLWAGEGRQESRRWVP